MREIDVDRKLAVCTGDHITPLILILSHWLYFLSHSLPKDPIF